MPDPQSVGSMGFMNSVAGGHGLGAGENVQPAPKNSAFYGRERVKTKTECIADPRMCREGQRIVLSGEVWI